MLILKETSVTHSHSIREDYGVPVAEKLVAAQERNVKQKYLAEIEFGTNGLSICESFHPEDRGLRRPHLITNAKVADTIKKEIKQRWSGSEILWDAGTHGAAEGLVLGLGAGVGLFGGPLVLHGLGMVAAKTNLMAVLGVVPGLNVVVGVATAKAAYAVWYASQYAMAIGAATGATVGTASATKEYRQLARAKQQDEAVFNILKIVDDLAVGHGYVRDRIAQADRDVEAIEVILRKHGFKQNPAAWWALAEAKPWVKDYDVECQVG